MPSPPAPPAPSGLLTRLDALADLVHRCGGLLLGPDGRLTPTDAAAVAHATGADPGRDRGDVQLLLLLGMAVGIIRADGLRVRVTALRDAWTHLDDTLRAGLVFAGWCHRVAWPRVLGEPDVSGRLQAGRLRGLRLLHGLPVGVEVAVPVLAATIADHAGLRAGPAVLRCVAAAFLDPLAALGAAVVDPPPPSPAARLRLAPTAPTVIGAALLAAGEPAAIRLSEAN